ncbi:MAG: SDR family NAD(P)-dependent oxidoreductase [Devosia sp.]|nr:SDR family NAD(P)-dependent oxidoreductase [Devosia sp.]
MKNILIAGANRGIGREFARQALAADWTVHGTARNDKGLAEVEAAGATAHRLDITDDDSIAALASDLRGMPFDAVLANAGVSGDQTRPIAAIDWDEMRQVFDTNTFGPLRLISVLRPNLLKGERRLALGMSSLMSSISSNDWGTQHCYRASKTALNAMWRSLATEWQTDGITCVLLRPGFVNTDMTNHQGMDVAVSVAGMLGVVEQLTIRDSGRVIGFDGLDVPW